MDVTFDAHAAEPGWLDRAHIVAKPSFNRWLVPPAALAIHLCIGMAYGFSVFWLPMSKLIPNPDPVACAGLGFMGELVTTTCNWSVPSITHVFEIFIALLGISAAIWGGWLEHAGPRKAGLISAICWGGGLVLLGFAISVHQLWLVYLVAVFCGVGPGPRLHHPGLDADQMVPRPSRHGHRFRDHGLWRRRDDRCAARRVANGRTASNGIPGVAQTMMALGVIYFVVMTAGAFGFRVSPTGWKPSGWVPKATDLSNAMITNNHVHVSTAWKTPQFWLIWGVLCLNVTAGIAVIAMASPMLQDVFGAKLVGVDTIAALTTAQKAAIVASAAGLVGLISLFNSLGRIFWASLSDKIGRKNMYYTIFVLGIVVYSLLPTWGHLGMPIMFVLSICVILSMYGGGFASMPAYLADIFGTQMVGAIHGRLITSWSVAGVVGPALIAGLRQFQINHGVAHNLVYDITLYVMAFLLFCGLICNFFVKPVNNKHNMSDRDLQSERMLQHEGRSVSGADTAARGSFGASGLLAWLAVGIPFAIGLYIALTKVVAMFG